MNKGVASAPSMYALINYLIFTVMKILSIIFYVIGSILLIVSCFTTSVSATWWLGGIAVVALIIGCVFQFNSNQANQINYRHHDYK